MPSDLFVIGKSGARAAKAALDLTAQNIANVHTEGYQRRTLAVGEITGKAGIGLDSKISFGGVRIEGVARSSSPFLQAEVRRTTSEAARSGTQIDALRSAERAIESANLFPALTELEASLAQLQNDPLSAPLRAQVIGSGEVAASAFNLAARGIENSIEQSQTVLTADVDRFNVLAGELARINSNLPRTGEQSSARVTLLDERDNVLSKMSEISGISVSFDVADRAIVRLNDSSGPVVVTGASTTPLAVTYATNGTASFTLGGSAVTPLAGNIAGQAGALDRFATLTTDLDTVAADLAGRMNAAQAAGVDQDGNTGQPFYSGTTAATIAVSLTDGRGFATAPAGSPANSRDISNLSALRASLAADDGPTASVDDFLFDLSTEISSRAITDEALNAIANSAIAALSAETAVDLDEEAADLIRFQQAFQASGKVIQTARDIFDTILGLA